MSEASDRRRAQYLNVQRAMLSVIAAIVEERGPRYQYRITVHTQLVDGKMQLRFWEVADTDKPIDE